MLLRLIRTHLAPYKRRLAGSTDDPFFDRLKEGVPAIAERARQMTMS